MEENKKTHHTQSNHTQRSIKTYDYSLQKYLSRRKNMNNNTNKKVSRNTRGKEVLVQKKIKRNITFKAKSI